MELLDKWETEDKINDANRNDIVEYFQLFEEHISPKSNTLIAMVELKRLFQETLSLEDFHMKMLRLVKEAKYQREQYRTDYSETQSSVVKQGNYSGHLIRNRDY